MTTKIVKNEEQYRVDVDVALSEAVESIFESQGLNKKEGTRRLFQFLAAMPLEIRPLIFGQVHGVAQEVLLEHLFQAMRQAKSPRGGAGEGSATGDPGGTDSATEPGSRLARLPAEPPVLKVITASGEVETHVASAHGRPKHRRK